jgi:hypothetical protein
MIDEEEMIDGKDTTTGSPVTRRTFIAALAAVPRFVRWARLRSRCDRSSDS